jgi:hypothetical protein
MTAIQSAEKHDNATYWYADTGYAKLTRIPSLPGVEGTVMMTSQLEDSWKIPWRFAHESTQFVEPWNLEMSN